MSAELESLLERRFQELTGARVEGCTVRFYPYARFTSTIRLRDGRLEVRLSDLLAEAEPAIVEAFALKLLHKLTRTRTPRALLRRCNEFVNAPQTVEREREIRRRRGRKLCLPAKGDVFDLQPLFEDLNRSYFDGSLRLRQLGWSPVRSGRRLGHYDPAHEAIVLSRRLDNPLVPEYVVRYVLYHEMLHVQLGEDTPHTSGRRRIHGPQFRLAEKRYPDSRRALDFIRTHFHRV